MFIIPQPAKMSRRAFFNCLILPPPGSFPAGLCRPPRRPGGHPPAGEPGKDPAPVPAGAGPVPPGRRLLPESHHPRGPGRRKDPGRRLRQLPPGRAPHHVRGADQRRAGAGAESTGDGVCDGGGMSILSRSAETK